jgi:ketosteroid isomerase-like protein
MRANNCKFWEKFMTMFIRSAEIVAQVCQQVLRYTLRFHKMHTSRHLPIKNQARPVEVAVMAFALGVIYPMHAPAQPSSPKEQVFETERAFAKTMANRDLAAFTAFLAEEAIFFNDPKESLRGKQQVVGAWAQYFKTTAAPFSWEPDQVEVLASGTLALSTGPVRDATGKVIARFNSVWRLEGSNNWRIVFDKGSPPSPGPQ